MVIVELGDRWYPREPQNTSEKKCDPHSFTFCVEDVGGKQPCSEALQIGDLWHCRVLTTKGSGPVRK